MWEYVAIIQMVAAVAQQDALKAARHEVPPPFCKNCGAPEEMVRYDCHADRSEG